MADLTDADLDQLIKAIGLKRPGGGSQRKRIAHGTYRGSKQHRYRKEPLCDWCRAAEAAYQRDGSLSVPRPDGAPSDISPPLDENGRPKQYMTEAEWQDWQARLKASSQ